MLYKVFSYDNPLIYIIDKSECYFAVKAVREYTNNDSYCRCQCLEVIEDISDYIMLTEDMINKGKWDD